MFKASVHNHILTLSSNAYNLKKFKIRDKNSIRFVSLTFCSTKFHNMHTD